MSVTRFAKTIGRLDAARRQGVLDLRSAAVTRVNAP